MSRGGGGLPKGGGPPYRMWGGRFQGQVDPQIARFTASSPLDLRLLPYDLRASLAHARMLADRALIPAEAGREIAAALRAMIDAHAAGDWLGVPPPPSRAVSAAGSEDAAEAPEDVHTLIEAEVMRRIGEAAGWLHLARSRNDQVATAFRMWAREAALSLAEGVLDLQETFLSRAETDGDALLPAYTHGQRAQPVLLAHHLLAHSWMLSRDLRRLQGAYESADVLPLGSGAAVGVSHAVDRGAVAAFLGFSRLTENSLDATGDRDFAADLLSAAALLMVHLSRWASEIVLWSSQEFGFVALGDAVSTGSSIMPQKRNPDPAELIRGKTGRVVGDLVALLVTLKGLPAGYGLDLQEDKGPTFDAVDAALGSLEAGTVLLREIRFRPERMRAALDQGFVTATELSDLLARGGIPFREAHRLAGAAVRYAEEAGRGLGDLGPEEWRSLLTPHRPPDSAALAFALTPEGAVAAKDVPGGTAPGRVREALAGARAAAAAARTWAGERRAALRRAEEALLW